MTPDRAPPSVPSPSLVYDPPKYTQTGLLLALPLPARYAMNPSFRYTVGEFCTLFWIWGVTTL